MSDARTAISGSRDTTLRVWDIPSGTCTNILMGHQASVRCLEIHGDLIVSGSYDTTAKIWSISSGQCLRTLQGHFSQIYAIAFDGQKIATGSLDTSVRIWNPHDGYIPISYLFCEYHNRDILSLFPVFSSLLIFCYETLSNIFPSIEPASPYFKATPLSWVSSKCANPPS